MQKLTAFLSLLLVSGSASAFDGSVACKTKLLTELGWSTQPATVTGQMQISPGLCEKQGAPTTLHGDLRLTGTEADAATLDMALQSPVSLCGYSQKFDAALQTAGANLQRNFMYWFDIPVLGTGVARMGALGGWQRVGCTDDDKCFMPEVGRFEDAFRGLYHGRYATECATGLQVTEYSAIHEMFGKSMESSFKPEELFVGDWADIENSWSVTHGRVGRRFADATGKGYARLGAEMMVGLTGYIGSLFPESFLDSHVNRNENFVLMATSDEAAAGIARNGLSYYTLLMRKIWSESRSFSRDEIGVIAKGQTVARDVVTSQLIIDQLNDPFLRDTILRIHPKGNWPIAKHILRLLQMNPRTPYGIAIYPESIHAEIYDRWVRARLQTCSEQTTLNSPRKDSL